MMRKIFFAVLTAGGLGLGLLPSAAMADPDFHLGINIGDEPHWHHRHHHRPHCGWVQVWRYHRLAWVQHCGWDRYDEQPRPYYDAYPDYPPYFGRPQPYYAPDDGDENYYGSEYN